jgi:catechol-2,3-dioxygenase
MESTRSIIPGDLSMPRIKPAKFVHVVYRTRRFEQMQQWYKTVFDAKVQHQDPVLAFMTYDDEHHRFAFINMSAIDPDGTDADRHDVIGVDHVAYSYGSLNDLFDNFEQLREAGIRPYWCVHHGITVSMYYADPDGNRMEFQIDCFGSNDEANAFMRGPHFSANPIGVEYDPDDWLARLHAGAPASEFLTRSTHQPVSPIRVPMAH